jgi:hypothetical protein
LVLARFGLRPVIALAVIGLIACVAGAAEALGPGPYVVKTTNFMVSPQSFGRNYLADGETIANSTPTTNGKRRYATGQSLLSSRPQLEEVALCL